VVELAHPAYRGTITGLYNGCYFTGSIIASVCTRFTANLPGNHSWDVPLYVQMIAPGIIICSAIFLPESPRWLYANHRIEKSKAILTKYHGLGNPDSVWVHLQVSEYEQFLNTEGSDKRCWD
jgi:MFS family permease